MIDTHCHLNHPDLINHIELLIKNANSVDINKFIVPGWDEKSSYDSITLSKKHPDIIFPAIGIHPWFTSVDTPTFIEDICNYSPPVAIGEIGLDNNTSQSINEQIITFKYMLDIARKFDLPVIIHARSNWEIILDILRENPVCGVMHAYSGSADMMRQFIDIGMHISFAASITRPNNKKIKLCANTIPFDRMLIETDAPGMAIHGQEKGKGMPENLLIIAQTVAEMRQISVAELVMQCDANAKKLFGIK